MTIRKLALAALTVALIASCGKDDAMENPIPNPPTQPEEPLLPGEVRYTLNGKLAIDDLVLYTSNGSSKDPQVIKDFVARNFNSYQDIFYYGQTSVDYNNSASNFSILPDNKVKLNGTVMEIISKTANEMIVSPMDSTDMPTPESEWIGRCMPLHTQIPQYNPYSICNANGGNCKKYRKQFPIIISGNDYYVPTLDYGLVSTCNIIYKKVPSLINYFNKAVLNGLLQSKDTVIVQTGKLKFTK